MTRPTEGSDRHCDEYELAEYHYGALDVDAEKQVRLHLDACAACSELVSAASISLPILNTAEALSPNSTVRDPVLPELLRKAWQDSAVASPGEGQLWRLRGPGDVGEIAALGAIVRCEEDHVWVVPVTPDVREATDLWTAQLRIANTELVMAFWTSLATPVGYEVLDVWLGWTDAQPLKELWRAQRHGEAPPKDLQLGRQLDEELAAYRADLGAEFLELQDARLVPGTADPFDAGAGDYFTELAQAGWAPSKLKAVTGDLTSGQAGDVLAGRRQLTSDQLVRVSAELGKALATAPAIVEWRWVVAVGYPTRRHRYENLAAVHHTDPWIYRAELAADPGAVAARKSEGNSVDWEALADQQLAALEQAAGVR